MQCVSLDSAMLVFCALSLSLSLCFVFRFCTQHTDSRLPAQDGKQRFDARKVKHSGCSRTEILQRVGGVIYFNEAEKNGDNDIIVTRWRETHFFCNSNEPKYSKYYRKWNANQTDASTSCWLQSNHNKSKHRQCSRMAFFFSSLIWTVE